MKKRGIFENDEPLVHAIDVRKLSTWEEPGTAYTETHNKAVVTAIVEAVKKGEITPL